MIGACQVQSVENCCIKCHRDFSRNLSCKILTFGFTTGKLLQLCFCGLLRSIKVSSRQPLNQFLSIEYFPSFQTLLDKIANFGENSVFRNSENFHIFEKFCLGVNTYKVTSGHPYHTHRVEQDRRNWKKCLFFDTKSALRTFEPPLSTIQV